MKYNVVIIDSGISEKNTKVDCVDLYSEKTRGLDYVDHGTQVVNIIHQEDPDLKVLMIKICNTYDDFSVFHFYQALDYIFENNISCDVINISLGSLLVPDFKQFDFYINRMIEKDIVLVSSFHPTAMSFPAAHEKVIGVDVSSELKDGDFVSIENSLIDIVGTSGIIRVKDLQNKVNLQKGSSFVAAQVSAKIAKHFKDNNIICEKNYTARKYIKNISKNNIYGVHSKVDITTGYFFAKSIKSAIVFPFNKEIHSLAANEDMLGFSVKEYFDFDISINKGKKICDILPYTTNTKVINNFSNIDWSDSFDTIICGHCGEYENMTHKSLYDDIIAQCLKNNKKIYLFESPSKEKNNLRSFCPNVSYHIDTNVLMGKLYRIGKPVLSIMGTSSVQGKFSLQLKLRRRLLEIGYKVSNISTEPSGYLFGFDAVIPMGYNSEMTLDSHKFVTLLNNVLHNVECTNPDIIVIGSQSGTVPISCENLGNMNFKQYELLLAACPDAVILCANCFDDLDYVKRTIQFIESSCKTQVIAVVVSVLDIPQAGGLLRSKRNILSPMHIEKCCKTLKSNLNIPVYSQLDNVDYLIEVIQDFFS